MALVQVAIEYTLKLEDAAMGGKVSSIPGDTGGATRFGLASRWHPELVAKGFYTDAVDRVSALILAGEVLMAQYAAPMCIAEINDQTVANVMMAYGVNEHPSEAIKTMQDACNRMFRQSQGIAIDGVMGPATIAAVNKAMPESLEARFRLLVIQHYVNFAQPNVLKGLCQRALA